MYFCCTVQKEEDSACVLFMGTALAESPSREHVIGVPAADGTKLQHYVECMNASDMFDEKEMQALEIKPSNDKMWDNPLQEQRKV